MRLLITQLESTTNNINEYDSIIKKEAVFNTNARLIDTIPGIGMISALGIAAARYMLRAIYYILKRNQILIPI